MSRYLRVTAFWDEEAGVWVATSDDIAGLVSEAKTLDALYARVLAVAPELLADDGISPADGEVDFHVVANLDLSAAE
jgi:predicted RNase H-like HicB family nuclease